MKHTTWILASSLLLSVPACDDDGDDTTQGSATDGASDSDGSDGSDGSDSSDSSDSTGGSGDSNSSGSSSDSNSSDSSGDSNSSSSTTTTTTTTTSTTTAGTSDSGTTGSTSGDNTGDLAETGQPCMYADECVGNVCLYENDQDDWGFCSVVCEDWTDCPDFWECVEINNAAYSACIPD